MTTVTRLLVSLLATVVATSAALWLVQQEGLNDNRRTDAVVVTLAGLQADLAPPFGLSEFDPETRDLIRASVGLYDEAGLSLPAIRFTRSDDRDECCGRDGMVIHGNDGPELRLCYHAFTPRLERVIIHELAHCWDRHELSDDVREAFLDLRGLDGWREGTWRERGAEHAAEIMVWGLIDRPVRTSHIDQNSCNELNDGYTTLTGQEPLHGYCDLCP